MKPDAVTFETFALGWLEERAPQHRRTTQHDYRRIVENHFIPVFGSRQLAAISTADIDAYVAAKRKQGLCARTLGIHITRLGSIMDAARRKGLIEKNPVRDAERPKVPKDRWTVLSPVEVGAVMRAFDGLVADAETDSRRRWVETAKCMVVTMAYAWLRRGELLGLRWAAVDLTHPDGPRLHVRETFVRGHASLPKTDDGVRTVALAAPLAEALWQHRRDSRFQGDGELVFCHPEKGTPVPSGYFGAIVREALKRAGIDRPMREFHDWRHSGVTNAAAAGMEPMAIMKMAGHANFSTTQRYISLAGVTFGDQVAKLSKWYSVGASNGDSASHTGIG